MCALTSRSSSLEQQVCHSLWRSYRNSLRFWNHYGEVYGLFTWLHRSSYKGFVSHPCKVLQKFYTLSPSSYVDFMLYFSAFMIVVIFVLSIELLNLNWSNNWLINYLVFNVKFEGETFDRTNNFSIWQSKVMDFLIQQECNIFLEDKYEEMLEKECEKINKKTSGTICLCLANNQKYFFMKEMKAK